VARVVTLAAGLGFGLVVVAPSVVEGLVVGGRRKDIGSQVARVELGVVGDDLGEGSPEIDAEHAIDVSEHPVVGVEEAVAISQRGELAGPHRQLKRAELGALDVRFGEHAGKGVEPFDGAVDRLEPARHRRAARRGHHALIGLIAAGFERGTVGVGQRDEVEDVGVVDRRVRVERRIRRECLRGLAGQVP
jgi:hypothetical protein